jgi:uncharacterized NAD(P)/FAD-binding protein YdhS
MVDPRPEIGPGLAYSTPFNEHLLNVPAGRMSAFADQPAHFVEWLRAHNSAADPDCFVPRRLYGAYLKDLFSEELRATAAVDFEHIRAEAISLDPITRGASLVVSDRSTVSAQKVVLALGNPASCMTRPSQGRDCDGWYASPWHGDALRIRTSGERILVLGSGLTAVDCVIALHSQERPCRTFMVSRRGILPSVHSAFVPAAVPPVLSTSVPLSQMFGGLREQITQAKFGGQCWRVVIDGLRPISNELWCELSMRDRKRFLRHLKTFWDAHRHRMASEVASRIDAHKAKGVLDLIAGRLSEVSRCGQAIRVRICLRQGGERVLEVDRAIVCTGIQEDYENSDRPLVRTLLEKGLARANELRLGFRSDEGGAILDASLTASSVLFTLGPPRRGDLLETTAVREIRAQAQALAKRLLIAT